MYGIIKKNLPDMNPNIPTSTTYLTVSDIYVLHILVIYSKVVHTMKTATILGTTRIRHMLAVESKILLIPHHHPGTQSFSLKRQCHQILKIHMALVIFLIKIMLLHTILIFQT